MSVTHGRPSTYRNPSSRCRCDDCRRANTERYLRQTAQRAARIQADPSLAPHGIRATYSNWGCRCDECCAAQSEYNAAYRAKRSTDSAAVPSGGAVPEPHPGNPAQPVDRVPAGRDQGP